MITKEKAKKIGITLCADSIGRDYVEKNANYSTVAFSEDKDRVFCFLGIDAHDHSAFDENILLTSKKEDAFPVKASCFVSLVNGTAQLMNCVKP